VAHLGPTNSGKTHAALTELMRARRSVILGVAYMGSGTIRRPCSYLAFH
jgi:hypothetical protein